MNAGPGNQGYTRTVEDVQSMISYAKLNPNNLTQITQAIYLSNSDSNGDNLRLLELNPDLDKEINEGSTLYFKGGASEKLVLCTEKKTYEIKEAEISNSLLLVSGLKFGQATSSSPLRSPGSGKNTSLEKSFDDEDADLTTITKNVEHKFVVKVFHDYLECREIQPRYRKLRELLELTRYSGPEHEYCINKKFLFTTSQLLDTIQCSRDELQKGLQLSHAIDFEGHNRILAKEYEYRVVSSLLALIAENSWERDDVDLDISLDSLKEIYPPQIIEGVFRLYTTPSKQCEGKFVFSEEMVCSIIAKNILQPGLKFHVDEFLTTWQEALPEGMHAKESYLRYIGIIDTDVAPPRVFSLIEETLPTNALERFKALFKAKAQWTLDQITPYIECLTTPQLTVTAVLAKHARSLMVRGQRFYVSKH